jgi:hypothetical protein
MVSGLHSVMYINTPTFYNSLLGQLIISTLIVTKWVVIVGFIAWALINFIKWINSPESRDDIKEGAQMVFVLGLFLGITVGLGKLIEFIF